MKKILYSLLLLISFYGVKAQNISFSSNGYINHFKKIDTLFYTEYEGQKPTTKTLNIDTNFSKSLLQFNRSFGLISKKQVDLKSDENKLSSFKKLLTTSFYAYSDGTLEAPTSVLFFKPNSKTSLNNFSAYGKVIDHQILKGYYYLYLNTNIYNSGDKIFALCDSLNQAGMTETIEPVFVRRIKLETDPLLGNEWNISNTGWYSRC
ncbi:MAG: hypothetical protein H7098_02185 [Oligoflexus sp.]|nr:hypothetical protein [Pseudopedobacter sp.]